MTPAAGTTAGTAAADAPVAADEPAVEPHGTDAVAAGPAAADGPRKRQHAPETGGEEVPGGADEPAAAIGPAIGPAIGRSMGPAEPLPAAEPPAKKQKATAALLSHLGDDEDD